MKAKIRSSAKYFIKNIINWRSGLTDHGFFYDGEIYEFLSMGHNFNNNIYVVSRRLNNNKQEVVFTKLRDGSIDVFYKQVILDAKDIVFNINHQNT